MQWGQNFKKLIIICLELEDGYLNLFMVTSLMIMNLALTVLYIPDMNYVIVMVRLCY